MHQLLISVSAASPGFSLDTLGGGAPSLPCTSAHPGSFLLPSDPPGALKELSFFPQMFLREKQICISPTRNSRVPDFSSAFRSCVARCPGRRELLGRGRGGLSHPAPPQCQGRAEPATRPDQLPREAPYHAGTQGHSQGSPLKPGSCTHAFGAGVVTSGPGWALDQWGPLCAPCCCLQ